jgi:hypothetical protein
MAVYRGAVRIAKGVEPTLFQRAVGYEYEDEKTIAAENGEQCRVRHTEHVPPDVRACILWLAQRRPPGWKASMLSAAARPSADMSAVECQAAIEEFQRQYGDGR